MRLTPHSKKLYLSGFKKKNAYIVYYILLFVPSDEEGGLGGKDNSAHGLMAALDDSLEATRPEDEKREVVFNKINQGYSAPEPSTSTSAGNQSSDSADNSSNSKGGTGKGKKRGKR